MKTCAERSRSTHQKLGEGDPQPTTDNSQPKTEKTMKTPPFWRWFTANEKKLKQIHSLSKNEQEELLYWLTKHLEYHNPRIKPQLNISADNDGPATLSFSAYSNHEIRASILHLLETAPPYKDWIINAFQDENGDEYTKRQQSQEEQDIQDLINYLDSYS